MSYHIYSNKHPGPLHSRQKFRQTLEFWHTKANFGSIWPPFYPIKSTGEFIKQDIFIRLNTVTAVFTISYLKLISEAKWAVTHKNQQKTVCTMKTDQPAHLFVSFAVARLKSVTGPMLLQLSNCLRALDDVPIMDLHMKWD